MADSTVPIAVIGMGCRLSGDAVDPEHLFDLCAEARDGWSTLPKDRLNPDGWYHPHQGRPGAVNVAGGYFLKDDLGAFDAQFFGTTPGEAAALDPQQRLLLEVCYETLENAGISPGGISGSNTSVFVGSSASDYKSTSAEDSGLTIPMYYATGVANSLLANRLSYFFNLKGPSIMVDTACSSSLASVYLACQSLVNGGSDQAIVGGCNVILEPRCWSAMTVMRFLSPDGRCYSFDHRANGYGRGEGAACILLKRLDDAIRDGNTIRGVIRHVGTNQDGKTNGIALPSQAAQEALIRRLYSEAGLEIKDTSYLETHGTGTQAGDPLEAGAIASIFAESRSHDEPLIIGSVKTNIGHTEGLSGLPSLIKTVLMLERQIIVPNCNFEKPNAHIPMLHWKLKVATVAEPWCAPGPLRASLNNFGFGGSNFHAIIEDAKGYMASRGLTGRHRKINRAPKNLTNGHSVLSEPHKRSQVFTLSAFHEAVGKQQLARLKSYVESQTKHADDGFMEDLSYTLAECRAHHTWRKAITARSAEELLKALDTASVKFTKSKRAVRLGFVFTGQGAHWYAMGRELIDQYPIFLESLCKAEKFLTAMGATWSLIAELKNDQTSSRLGLASLSQPVCTAIQIALVDLLNTWGIRPSAVTGHSSGEIAAAYCCGAISQESAMLISYHRGVLAASINKNHPHLKGGMMAASLTPQEAENYTARLVRGKLSIACVNSPTSVTLSGDMPAVDELHAILQSEGVFSRKLFVDVAYHSSHTQVATDEYLVKLSKLEVGTVGKCGFYSSVTGDKLDSSKLGSHYWVENMLSKVRFAESVKALCLDNVGTKRQQRNSALAVDFLIEIGPHAALSGPIKEIIKLDPTLDDSTISYRSALYRGKDAAVTVLDLVGSLFEAGYDINFPAINRPNTTAIPNLLVDLPPFAWDHSKRYWAESRVSKQLRLKGEPRADLLGMPSVDSTSLEPKWRNMLRAEEIPWVRDHKVQSNIVYPGAAYICSAIEAVNRRAAANGSSISMYKLRNIVIKQALIIPEESAEIEIVVSLRPLNESVKADSKDWDEFCVQSLSNDGIWVENCRGLITTLRHAAKEEEGLITHDDEEQAFYAAELTSLTASCHTSISTQAIYKGLADLGLEYGPTFANMKTAAVSPGACVATVTIADTAATMPSGFQFPHILHPSTLDALFHTVFPCDVNADGQVENAIILTGIDEIVVSNSLSTEPGYALLACTRTSKVDDHSRKGTTYVFGNQDQSHGPIITIKGIKYISHNNDSRGESIQDAQHAMHEFVWKPDVTFPVIEPENLYPPLVVPSEEVERILALEKAAYYYVENTLRLVSTDEVLKDHHQAQYRWMLRAVDMIKHNGFDYSSDKWVAATPSEREEFLLRNSTTSDEARLLAAVGAKLTDILRGSVPPLSVIMEDGMLGKFYANNITSNGPLEVCQPYIDYLAHKNPHLRILEIGAGTGGMTYPVLRTLGGQDGTTPRFTEYTFTDISSGFFEAAREKLKEWSPLVSYQKLDIEMEPSQQGFPLEHYDVVIAHNVLHATTQIKRTLKHVRSLLRPGGRLLLSEITVEKLSTGLVWGTLPGWWAGLSEGRLNGPLLTEDEWSKSLQGSGFSGLDLTLWKSVPHRSLRQGTFMVAQATEPQPRLPREITVLSEDGHNQILIEDIKSELQKVGSIVHTRKLADIKQANKQFFLALSELTGPILKSPSEQQFEALKTLLCDCEGVLWVTRGSSMTPSNPDTSLFVGLANSLRTEVGGGAHISLDLDDRSNLGSKKTTKTIVDVFKTAFDLGHPNRTLEVSYSERGGLIYIPRVVDQRNFQTAYAVETQPPVPTDQPYHQHGRSLAPKVRVPGLLDTIYFDDDPYIPEGLADNFVQIRVLASGLNFRDLFTSMGQIMFNEMGLEAAGVITAVGKNVHDLQVGDRVVTMGHNLLTNVAYVPQTHALKFSDTLSFERAAAIPIVYTTAYFCLFDIARVAPGEKVLIHAAAGGLGHAAIDVCRYAGAEIFATVSSKEKKALLMSSFGIPEDHIFSSRKAGFGAAILRASGGNGVDIVLNSTSGDFIRESLSCVAAYGRFIELGRFDFLMNSRLEMEHMARNVSFIVMDLLLYLDERPSLVMTALKQVLKLIGSGELRMSLTVNEFPMSGLESALRTMQAGRHTGKLVVVQPKDDVVKAMPRRGEHSFLRTDATYVLVGGSGGLGTSQALWMASHGAKHIILASRSGSSKEEVKALLETLRGQGIDIVALRCDVSRYSDVEKLVSFASANMPPIRGLIHGGMVLRDTLFGRMQFQDWLEVLAPKVQGTWNLHNLLPQKNMDFFIMLSSIVGVRGNASQGAYSAAGAFLDAFAHYRRSLGLPAVSIDLGKIDEIGFVAESNEQTSKRLDEFGVSAMNERQYLALLKVAMEQDPKQIITGFAPYSPDHALPEYQVNTFAFFRRAGEAMKQSASDDGSAPTRVRDALRLATSLEEATTIFCTAFVRKMSVLLMVVIENIDFSKSINDYGMDSLVAVEMRNWLFKEMDITIPILELLANQSLSQLSGKLVKKSNLTTSLFTNGDAASRLLYKGESSSAIAQVSTGA